MEIVLKHPKLGHFDNLRFKIFKVLKPDKASKNAKKYQINDAKVFFKTLSKKHPLTKILSFRAVTRDGNLFGK